MNIPFHNLKTRIANDLMKDSLKEIVKTFFFGVVVPWTVILSVLILMGVIA